MQGGSSQNDVFADTVICLQRLEPFFPAFEPVQSIKLRSALFQALNTLKHDGILGRDCVLRRSLLDDCNGDKFEELLYSFSTAVLRKVSISSREHAVPAVGEQLATAEALPAKDVNLLGPLSLAYEKRLRHLLSRRDYRHRRGKELDHLVKEQHTDRTTSTLNALERLLVAHEALVDSGVESDEAMRKRILENIACDPEWLHLILNGNSYANRDPFMEDDYRNVWKTTQCGKFPKYKTTHQSLMTDLEVRVEQQQQRLLRWRKLQGEVSSRNEQFIIPTPKKTPQRSPSKSQRPTSLRASHRKAASAHILSTPNPRSAALNNISPANVGIDAETPSRVKQKVVECDMPTPQLSEKRERSGKATSLKVRPRSLSPRKNGQTASPSVHAEHRHTGGNEALKLRFEPPSGGSPTPKESRSPVKLQHKGSVDAQTPSSQDAPGAEVEVPLPFESTHTSKHYDNLSSRTRQTLNPRPSSAHVHAVDPDRTTSVEPSPNLASAKDDMATAPLSLAQRTRASVLLMSTSKPNNGNDNDAIIGSSAISSVRQGNKNKSSMRKKSRKLSRSFPVNPFEEESQSTPHDLERADLESPTEAYDMKDLDETRVERNGEVVPIEDAVPEQDSALFENPFTTRSRVRRSQPSSPIG